MDSVNKLLCIDLQVDAGAGLQPDAPAIFGARQLLAIGRGLGWTIVHARRRSQAPADRGQIPPGVRPLKTERVFFRGGRSITGSPGLCAMLESWRGETVYVAAFDHIALMSCLLQVYDRGPHLVLVEDALAAGAPHAGKPSLEAFNAVQAQLACGATSISRILATAPGGVAA